MDLCKLALLLGALTCTASKPPTLILHLTCFTGKGEAYRGTTTVTESGKTCQSWSTQTPHQHSRTPENNPGKGLVNNYCRNPDNEASPWCYTTDPDSRWEYCNVPSCEDGVGPGSKPHILIPHLTCFTGKGEAYRGTTAVTESGKTCQSWSAQKPHEHSRTPDNYPRKGLVNNYCRNPDNERRPWCYTTDSDSRWEYCSVPRCEDTVRPGSKPPTLILHQTCFTGRGEAYRGTTAVTESGKTCQSWSAQTPHQHDRTPENNPGKGLVKNYCRNPDNETSPWCYTTDPDSRWEYCDVPSCEDGVGPGSKPPTLIPHLTCFTGKGEAYRGTTAVTESGKTCQSWSAQTPHEHSRTPDNYPGKGLVNNYCRNPDNERRPWCYTTDSDSRWEYCSVPRCEDAARPASKPLILIPHLTCFTGKGEAYRGTTAVTESGKTCQSWSAQTPHQHSRTPENNPGKGLVKDYCRNPDNEASPWCYTTDPDSRWEYCDVPSCEDGVGPGSKPPTLIPHLTCFTGKGETYRGTTAVTESGKTCQSWSAQKPHEHSRTPDNYPGKGLVNNYCRNPDNERRPWCYTTDSDSRWEYCSVPRCEDAARPASKPPTLILHQTCFTGRGEAYRGTTAVTESGKTCQSWSAQTPHQHDRTPENNPGKGLVNNYCRNPDNETSPWCYTTDPDSRWEYCDVPSCDDGVGPGSKPHILIPHLTCFTGKGEAYRGTTAVTESGKTCQSWSAQKPHEHSRTPDNYPGKGLVNNYCRNPDNERRPWCYTTDSDSRWEYCSVPRCEDAARPASKPPTLVLHQTCFTGRGEAYRGTTAVTESGKTCQSWSAQTPHQHDRTPENNPGKGLVNNYCRNPDNEGSPWCYTTDPDSRWEYCDVPSCEDGVGPGSKPPTLILHQTCFTGKGEAYRGTTAVTESGKTCQSWSVQKPHEHSRTPDNYPGKGLVNNYCRNPDNERRPWCYTTDSDSRWEYCSVPRCEDAARPASKPPTLILHLTCFTGRGEAYRGTTAVTESGKTCQSWSAQTPHQHDRTPENNPGKGLVNNYCRNPDNEGSPWCYTTDPDSRWEYCDVPSCEDGVGPASKPPTLIPHLTCFTGKGEAYRGTTAVTESGKTCQSWSAQKPHEHSRTPDNYPGKGLVNNYCRNPDNERRPWCYTTDSDSRWEYCSVPRCEDAARPGSKPPTLIPHLTCFTGKGEAYRGTTAVTESGKTCQSWSTQTPHQHDRTPDNYPGKGLVNNYCRNPDNVASPWCYTTDPDSRWEYCSVPSCEDGVGPGSKPPTLIPHLTCFTGRGEAYRGTTAVTESGKTCQSWSAQTPHQHDRTPDNYPGKGLVNNYCRNPDNVASPWCYTTDPDSRWEYCDVPSCEDGVGPASKPLILIPHLTCFTGKGEAYRGTTAVTESGKTCQSWSVQTPHQHDRTADNYPGKGLVNNYCRNPDNVASPWCYTTDPDSRWEHCSVPSCEDGVGPGSKPPTLIPHLTCFTGKGEAYRGTTAVTESGKTCQSWSAQTPHQHDRTPDNYPGKGLVNNYCRNPDKVARPWCYTTDSDSRWEYCSVPSCEDAARPGSKPPTLIPHLTCFTGKGEAYRGTTAVTESGKTCQSWSAQKPHEHSRTPDNYPGKGLVNNYCRNPDNERRPWCYTTDSDSRWEYCSVPRCEDAARPASKPPTLILHLTCFTGKGEAYRGTTAVTESGKTCQSWSAQTPHQHSRTPENNPGKGLVNNYCRNPDNEASPWCYTTDPDSRWEYCDVPSCEDGVVPGSKPPTLIPHLTCFTGKGEAYRGTTAVTESGKTCQSWSAQKPHQHSRTPDNYPGKGLVNNYCRNPDNERRPWCYTTDSDSRWEYCSVPRCEDAARPASKPPTLILHLTCFTGKGEAYRGTTAVTESGKTCQSWSAQTPHQHSRTPENNPGKGLVNNYCRNPDNETSPWCYTTDPDSRWEYCDVPSCEDGVGPGSKPPTLIPHLTCFTGKGEAYRGTTAVTESGKTCQSWSAQKPHEHSRTPDNYPGKGLVNNYCRNPDNERRPWCYTTDSDSRWEYCSVPRCEDAARPASKPPTLIPHQTCFTGKGETYRGTTAVTESSKTCQSWSAQTPHQHDRTPDNYPGKGLVNNYCRNPDDEKRPWCYTTDSDSRWEYCDVPRCEDAARPVYILECTFGTGKQYRGTKSKTKTGKTCQRWEDRYPHVPNFTPQEYQRAGLESNFCRNPDGASGGPWCYTTDPDTRWEYCNVANCTDECMQCNGEDYRGKISITENSYTCQRWDSQEPHRHGYDPHVLSDKDLVENFCRNPDASPRPWCFTTDPSTRWDYCTIPRCTSEPPSIIPELTCVTGNGEAYRGAIAVTKSGKTCQSWSAQTPHEHDRTLDNFPCKGLDENYCRNPDNEEMPWCYTTDSETRWEYCNLEKCTNDSSEDTTTTTPNPQPPSTTSPPQKDCKTGNGETYQGSTSITTKGVTCQAWSAQSPHQHKGFTPETHPDKGLEGNSCRNPDGDAGGPWCYTTDNNTRWDYCHIPNCVESKCGTPVTKPKHCFGRIVGGCVSKPHSWPWQISLQTNEGFHFCGGSLIDHQWVLTAAHCLHQSEEPAYYKVLLGIQDLSGNEPSQQERNVEKLIRAPNNTDIALLKLQSPAMINDKVMPVCLPEQDYIVPTRTECYVTGWGRTQGTGGAGVLKETGVPVIENKICNGPSYMNGLIKDHEMCAGINEGGMDTCQGDSGGPLVCKSQNSYILQGVTSWGIGCATPMRPGVYARVSKFVDWINKAINEN